jgi:predicted Rossmann fold nucleotide-binding protein DprA/Smf involved in DNA uptake
MTKVTIADKFDALADYIQNGENSIFPTPEDAIEFINDRKEKAMKKSDNRKPTAQQKENEGFKENILDVLTSEGKTVSEIIAMSDDLSGLTNQRVSALLRQLVLAGKVVKTKEGKKSLFTIAE